MSKVMPLKTNADKPNVFCPVLMEESRCELTGGIFCDKNLAEKIECAGVLERQSIYNLIPPNSFLFDFINYCNKITDAPDIFEYTGALIALSTILQKNVFLKWAGGKLYPNMYMLLIMKSGGRKSTVSSIVKKILEKFDKEETSLIYPNDITPEAFYSLAQNQSYGTFFHTEFGGFLKSLDRNYNKGMKEFLTDVYDGFSQKKLIKGPNGTGQMFKVDDPAVNILSASTVSWIADNLKESDLKSGFMQRFTIFYARQDKKEITLPISQELPGGLITRLKELLNMEGEIKLAEEAKVRYEEFYYGDNETKKRQSEIYASYHTRLYTVIIKVAMLYCIMRKDDTIQKEDIEYGIALKLILEKYLYSVYDKLIKDRNKEILEKILNIISDNGGVIERSKLLRYTHMLKRDFDNFIDTLIERRSIAVRIEKTKTKSAVYYKKIGN
ncbi:MAG: DUF3987 domain-containing protein [bacterium]